MKKSKKCLSVLLAGTAVLSAISFPVSANAEEMKNSLIINEVCTDNTECLTMSDGTHPDFIELYNGTNHDIDLSGYGVSDKASKPLKTKIKDGTIIGAGEYLVILCSKDSVADDSEVLVALGLSKSGESVFLSDKDGVLIDSVDVPELKTDTTYSRADDMSWCVSSEPTPGEKNITSGEVDDTCNAPVFSQESGFYNEEFELSISCDEDAKIYYTTDGSIPTAESMVYSGEPVLIKDATENPNVLAEFTDIATYAYYYPPKFKLDKANVIRAVAIDNSGNVSDVVTKSYFVGFDSKSDIYRQFPVINLSTDYDNLFGDEKGIYCKGSTYKNWVNSEDYDENAKYMDVPANYHNSGKQWEREAYIQYFDTNGKLALQQNGGVRIKGNFSRMFSMKSFNLYAKSSYEKGKDSFDYSFFGDKTSDFTGQSLNSFDKFSLQTGASGIYRLKYRNTMVAELSDGLSCYVPEQTPCIVFLDGEYWGLYWLSERVSANSIANNFNVKEDDVLLIKNGELEDGKDEDFVQYEELTELLQNGNTKDEAVYKEICDKVDVQTLIDYLCAELITANMDYVNTNYALWKSTATSEDNVYSDGKWRFILFDCDHTMSSDGTNSETHNTFVRLMTRSEENIISNIFSNLIKNDSFKQQFVSSFMDVCNTRFSKENMLKVLDEIDEEYSEAIKKDYFRWLDVYSDASADKRYSNNLAPLRSFCDGRESYISTQIKSSLKLKGDKVNVTVKNNINMGTVTLNTLTLEDSTFSGSYYTDYPVALSVKPDDEERFIGWKVNEKMYSAEKSIELKLDGDTEIEAVYENPVYLVGDVDKDGKINIQDTTAIMRYLSEDISLDDIQVLCADTNGDGKVDVNDATVLQRYIAEVECDNVIGKIIEE